MLLLTGAVVLLTLAKDAAAVQCPGGWVNWHNYCYYFPSESKTFQNAKSSCEAMTAHLISIHSRGETAVVTRNGMMTYDHWLGMRRNSSRQGHFANKWTSWHWLDGTSFDFYNWDTGEPNTNAQCGVINKQTGIWVDKYCTQTSRFICKKALPQPTTTLTTTTTTLKPTTTNPTTITTTPGPTTTTTTTTTPTTPTTITTTSPTTTTIPTTPATTTTTTTTIISAKTTMTITFPNTHKIPNIPASSPGQTGYMTSPTKTASQWMTTGTSETDWTTWQDNVTVTTGSRQEGRTENAKAGLSLYIGVAAACVTVVLAAVVAGLTIYKRKRRNARDSNWMSKPYVEPDGDYVYARNETPHTVDVSSVDKVPRRPGHRSHTPYESIHMEDNAFNVNGVTSAAMLNADQRTQSPASAGNTDEDTADLYAVPTKKKKRQDAASTPETSPADNTEIEHMENNLYQTEGYDNDMGWRRVKVVGLALFMITK